MSHPSGPYDYGYFKSRKNKCNKKFRQRRITVEAKALADLKSQFSAWDKGTAEAAVETQTKGKKMSIIETLFNCIRDNPGQTTSFYNKRMYESHKFNSGSTSSYLYQLIKAGLCVRKDSKLYVTQERYTPMDARLLAPNKAKFHNKPTTTPTEVKSLQKKLEDYFTAPEKYVIEESVATHTTVKRHVWSANEVVDTLTVVQAKEVYLKLKELFTL